jgi:hypothetical protein
MPANLEERKKMIFRMISAINKELEAVNMEIVKV